MDLSIMIGLVSALVFALCWLKERSQRKFFQSLTIYSEDLVRKEQENVKYVRGLLKEALPVVVEDYKIRSAALNIIPAQPGSRFALETKADLSKRALLVERLKVEVE